MLLYKLESLRTIFSRLFLQSNQLFGRYQLYGQTDYAHSFLNDRHNSMLDTVPTLSTTCRPQVITDDVHQIRQSREKKR